MLEKSACFLLESRHSRVEVWALLNLLKKKNGCCDLLTKEDVIKDQMRFSKAECKELYEQECLHANGVCSCLCARPFRSILVSLANTTWCLTKGQDSLTVILKFRGLIKKMWKFRMPVLG